MLEKAILQHFQGITAPWSPLGKGHTVTQQQHSQLPSTLCEQHTEKFKEHSRDSCDTESQVKLQPNCQRHSFPLPTIGLPNQGSQSDCSPGKSETTIQQHTSQGAPSSNLGLQL